MSYAAQCLVCQYARRDTPGCNRFDGEYPSGQIRDMADILASLLYINAGKARCPAFSRIVIHKDGYFAQDA